MDKEFTVFITGSTDGLGKVVATHLASRGVTLLLHGRDPDKGRRVVEEIRDGTGSNRLRYLNADLSSLAEVERLAAAVEGEVPRLDVLINNAGLGAGPEPKTRRTSADGHELIFAVNFLAPFLLTRRLLPLLHRTAGEVGEARVVNVASAAQQAMDFRDVMLENGYDGMRAYSQSKLAMVMWTFDLAAELGESGVTVNALHPASLMDTRMVREWFGTPRASVEEGARHVVRLAIAAELKGVNGLYFEQDKQARPIEQAYDEGSRRRLRDLALQLTDSRLARKRETECLT